MLDKNAKLTIGQLYWILGAEFATDPVTGKFRFMTTKFSGMLTEYNEKGEPLFLGKDGIKHYKLVFETQEEVDRIIKNMQTYQPV